jgi:hypothetical protein
MKLPRLLLLAAGYGHLDTVSYLLSASDEEIDLNVVRFVKAVNNSEFDITLPITERLASSSSRVSKRTRCCCRVSDSARCES